MNCPFLKEQRVKFCGVSAFRKMILLDTADTAHEVCSGPSYPKCSVFPKTGSGLRGTLPFQSVSCPSLHESLVQYCAASAFQKFVPASEPRLLRCGRPAFTYCDLYRATLTPDTRVLSSDAPFSPDVPSHLSYARNHMWFDQVAARQCQIGLDTFLARVTGTVDQLTFLTVSGLCRPTVVLTVKGVDLRLAFPARILITAANLYLRADPARLTADPFGSGWLFEGEPEDVQGELTPGTEAGCWVNQERGRLAAWVRERVKQNGRAEAPRPDKDADLALLNCLPREDLLSLFDEFFPNDDTHRR